jgi:hypothetical protein
MGMAYLCPLAAEYTASARAVRTITDTIRSGDILKFEAPLQHGISQNPKSTNAGPKRSTREAAMKNDSGVFEMKQVWGVLAYAIGGGFPALTLYETENEAQKEARRLNDSEDWTAEVKEYKVAPDAFPESETYPISMRPAELVDRYKKPR